MCMKPGASSASDFGKDLIWLKYKIINQNSHVENLILLG